MNTLLTKSTLSAAIVLTLIACGGGGGNVAGIGGSGFISSGSVTGFGSVFVNGVEFETNSAIFDIDGESGIEKDLAIGMVVKVNGSINDDGITGTATSISFDDELQGPVSAIQNIGNDGVQRSLSILGITVIIDSGSTTFDISGDITPPPVGAFDFDTINLINNTPNINNVEVSGFFDNSGNLQATRVELKDIDFDVNSIVEVKGTIAGLINTDFNLGNPGELTVKALNAVLDDLPNGLANGLLVEVKGTFDTVTKIITATKVEAENNSVDDTSEFELEGIITDYLGDNNFKIGEISVNASTATREPATLRLANDLRVEVEGAIINGTLVAKEIELEGGNIKVHANVTTVDIAGNTFTVTPVAGQPPITVTVTTDTQLEDDVTKIEPYTLTNLFNNKGFVEVRGFDDGNGGITATEVDVKDPDDVIVQGNATDATGNSASGTITVLGVTFNFDDVTPTDFEDANDNDLTPPQINTLINAISPATPQLVKIKDNIGSPDGFADEIDIETP